MSINNSSLEMKLILQFHVPYIIPPYLDSWIYVLLTYKHYNTCTRLYLMHNPNLQPDYVSSMPNPTLYP